MKILHLYYDLMNLWGDYANVSALLKILKANSVEYSIDRLSIKDEIKFCDYDFVYVGSGTEQRQKIALSSLKRYKEDLREYVEEGKFLLMTGNSFEMLGEKIITPSGEYEGLGLFGFSAKEGSNRITGDAVYTFGEQTLVGFINKCSEIKGIETPLFEVKFGVGDSLDAQTEGIIYKNFIGTHLTGPILVKNPMFLHYVAQRLCLCSLSLDAFSNELSAYYLTKRKLEERNG